MRWCSFCTWCGRKCGTGCDELAAAAYRVLAAAAGDLHEADVEMRLTRWNRNYVGVHFDGSLLSMTDPFYALMLAANLGLLTSLVGSP